MNSSEYRKQYEKKIEEAVKKQVSRQDVVKLSRQAINWSPSSLAEVDNEDTVSQMVRIILDKDEKTELRITALQMISLDIGKSHEYMDIVLEILGDETETHELRMNALLTLKQLGFSSIPFRTKRPEYINTLKAIIEDKDRELRTSAIETLAIEKDEYIQRRLLDQLQGRSKPLVSTTKAIQLLGYDIHAEHYPILREIIKNPPSRAAKMEAVRLLASDPSSKELLMEILRDKDEHRDVRKLSAAALQILAPEEFEQHAKQIILDQDDYDEIKTVSINALNQFASPNMLSQDSELNEQIKALNETAKSKHLKRTTSNYMTKQSK